MTSTLAFRTEHTTTEQHPALERLIEARAMLRESAQALAVARDELARAHAEARRAGLSVAERSS